MTIRSEIVTLPAAWASALVNGDLTGLTTAECFRVNAALGRLSPGHVVAVDGQDQKPRYTSCYYLYDPDSGFSSGEVLDYVVHYHD